MLFRSNLIAYEKGGSIAASVMRVDNTTCKLEITDTRTGATSIHWIPGWTVGSRIEVDPQHHRVAVIGPCDDIRIFDAPISVVKVD